MNSSRLGCNGGYFGDSPTASGNMASIIRVEDYAKQESSHLLSTVYSLAYSLTLKMETLRSSAKPEVFHRTTWRHILSPEIANLVTLISKVCAIILARI
jgi:hypothetical protein